DGRPLRGGLPGGTGAPRYHRPRVPPLSEGPVFTIEQAVCSRDASGRLTWGGHSPGFLDAWREQVERLWGGFGERPAGGAWPGAGSALRFGKRHAAVVGAADAVGSTAIRFHILVFARQLSRPLGDPFVLAARSPATDGGGGDLPTLEWPPEPLPPRTVGEIQK